MLSIFQTRLLRILAAGIDIILVYVTSLIVIRTLFPTALNFSDIYAQLIFVLYTAVMISGYHGQTLGKMLSKQQVAFSGVEEKSLLIVGVREVAKMIYFLPYIGIVILVLSIGLSFLGKGKMLHDYIAESEVRSMPNKQKVR